MRSSPRRTVLAFALLASTSAGAQIDFARDVYPIFQRSCFECHGEKKAKGSLRLHTREAAFDDDGVIAKGNAAASELFRRITLPKSDEEVMPNRGEPLSKEEIARIKAWINAGAPWPEGVKPQKHWAYVAPARPPLPEVKTSAWPRNAIDRFVLARLESEGLSPSPEAAPATLCRRLYLDLIGLPPTPAETDAFVQAASANRQSAIDALVDRLLASDQFGVRWARPWLDLARYADSHGFQRDDLHDIWPYRDWVVNALNSGMPFDQFTIEQLAGDLLPNATEAQKIATGFNRCAPTNVEAGSDPEETRVNQVFDRVNTLGAVWLGTTLECAQCHDHKYDPIAHQDYYRLFAFFNQTALEADRSNPKTPGSIRFLGPYMPVSDAAKDGEQTQVRDNVKALKRQIAKRTRALEAETGEWEAKLAETLAHAASIHPLTPSDFDSSGGANHKVLDDQSVLLVDDPPDKDTYTVTVRTDLKDITGFKLETLTDPSLPGTGPGRGDAQRSNFVLNQFVATAGGQPVKLKSARASFSQAKWDVAGLVDDDPKSGWAIGPQFHQPHWATFECAEPVGAPGGTVLTFKLVQEFGSARTIGRLRLSAITGDPNGPTLPDDVASALRTPEAQRTDAQRKRLRDLQAEQDVTLSRLTAQLAAADRKSSGGGTKRTLVMQEVPEPRVSTMFKRGDFRSPGEGVTSGVPAVLQPLAADAGTGRLALARWLVSRDNPLTARVTVNRWWADLFGRGIVATPEDFGLKGELPTHPEMLDWLAVEFMENGWSLKKLLRTIVTSATYQQSARATPELLAHDDANRLYARGPRFRMDAEMIRDNALAIAGLLSPKLGGEPIRPHQPDGLWTKVGGQKYEYAVSPGDEKYRRGLFVVWKRSAPYPSFVNFDATARFTCQVKRSRSNTPLQALTLLNDPVYVETAKALAKRTIAESGTEDIDTRLGRAFRLCVARPPNPNELQALRHLYDAQLAAANQDAGSAGQLAADAALPSHVPPAEFAALYSVATALLNLDETITKE